MTFFSTNPNRPAEGMWDQQFVKDLNLPDTDRKVFVLPGAEQDVEAVNQYLSKHPKALLIITSDEEATFQIDKLDHPDLILYTQYNNGGNLLPVGYTPSTRSILKSLGVVNKQRDWFFAGQTTHYRRNKMVELVSQIPNGFLHETKGFAHGLEQQEYLTEMSRSSVVLCPPGAVSQDSFRIYEALEAGCVPVVDDVSPLQSSTNYFIRSMLKDAPFPIISRLEDYPDAIERALEPGMDNSCLAWWINRKFRFRKQIELDLGIKQPDTTVIMTTSPIPSHPSTKIIKETISTIRTHTNAPILVLIDGVREEQADLVSQYQGFIKQFLFECNFEYQDVLPVLFNSHQHQASMVRRVMPGITTPFTLFVEHDTPLTPDRSIPWVKLKSQIEKKDTNLIRFHFEAHIPEPHRYLMVGEPVDNLQKTKQWSQRPFLASTNYLEHLMETNFTKDSRCFIEDKLHGVCQTEPWEDHRLTIYHPEGDIKRSYHLDGRANQDKLDTNQIW